MKLPFIFMVSIDLTIRFLRFVVKISMCLEIKDYLMGLLSPHNVAQEHEYKFVSLSHHCAQAILELFLYLAQLEANALQNYA